MTIQELTKLVNELYLQHKNIALVGMILRDKYNILSIRKTYNVKLVSLLQGLKLPAQLVNLLRSFIAIYNHNEQNKRDKHTRKIFTQKINDIKKTILYLKRRNKLHKTFAWSAQSNEQILGRNDLL